MIVFFPLYLYSFFLLFSSFIQAQSEFLRGKKRFFWVFCGVLGERITLGWKPHVTHNTFVRGAGIEAKPTLWSVWVENWGGK